DDVFSKIDGLSGGEKGRLTLAVVMKQRHNLLLLDEPTNHLDLDSREALEESLEDFPGSIVFVSHDRAFIDRLATRVIDLRDGRAVLMSGNYSETADARAERRRRPEPLPKAQESPALPTPAPAPAAAAPPAAARPASPPARRSPTQDDRDKEAAKKRRRIKTLEERISALEAEVEALETRLWEEALTLGPVAAHELSKQKLARKDELDALVEEWGRLSEEAESPAPRPS
ncbi:MAG TPA: ATP-binding cassette domain-containing protein, partial [Thermoanaerobaculia bacterium]|nr:ATP-binding cassette domain-containing protein [Thermoanaerobaculia bacterium]